MIHIFNRRELVMVFSDRQLYRMQEALAAADIPYQTKSVLPAVSAGRYHGTQFINSDAAHPCAIYVRAADYERAEAAIQPVLRDGVK